MCCFYLPPNYNMISPWVEVIVGFYHKWLEVVSKFPSGFIIYLELSSRLRESEGKEGQQCLSFLWSSAFVFPAEN